MKKFVSFMVVFVSLITISCSKCYKCEVERQYTLENGTVVTDTVSDDICTATGSEIDSYESEGYTCTPNS